MFKEKPKFCNQRGPLLAGKFVKFAVFFMLRIFRHLCSPILLELVEIAIETVRLTMAYPIAAGVGVKLAAERIAAYQAKEKSNRRKYQEIKNRH